MGDRKRLLFRRSASDERENNLAGNDTKEDIDQLLKANPHDGGESHNKENVSETARLNRSANRKRLLSLCREPNILLMKRKRPTLKKENLSKMRKGTKLLSSMP